MRSLVKRVAVTAAAVSVAVVPTLAVAAPAVSAPSSVPAASLVRVSVFAEAPVEVGEDIYVRVRGVHKAQPVTIRWGNGKTATVQTSCSLTKARNYPSKCGALRYMRYGKAGTYSIRLVQDGKVFYTTSVTVGPGGTITPPPAPEPTPTPTATPTPTPTPTPTVPAPSADWQQDMLRQVNSLRSSVGAGPVSLCAPLTRAAQQHSEDMAARDYFSHVSPEGNGPGVRINGQGYIGGWGENIAAGYPDVTAVMQGWINSPGHYANLINANYTHIGFGKANGGSYGIYWTQNFGYRGTC